MTCAGIASLNLLGTLLSRKGRYDEALASFREALRHDGDNLAAQKNIAYTTALRDYQLRARPGGR
jgi:cytochrome c-type biogenesis protein CcmH/NrfG